jgi:ankyrin repeat protein
MVKLLLSSGSNPNYRLGEHGYTLLMLAAKKGYDQVASLLIEAGADVHARNDFGETALKLARLYERKRVVQILESRGAAK